MKISPQQAKTITIILAGGGTVVSKTKKIYTVLDDPVSAATAGIALSIAAKYTNNRTLKLTAKAVGVGLVARAARKSWSDGRFTISDIITAAAVTKTTLDNLPSKFKPPMVTLIANGLGYYIAFSWLLVPFGRYLGNKLYDLSEFGRYLGNQVFEYFNDAVNWQQPYTDPVAIDLNGDGVISTIGLNGSNSVYFGGDGKKIASGWLGKEDGWLVLYENGKIQLFGLQTGNGFIELAKLDSNKDGVLDANDAAFANLKVWTDKNQDANVQSGELLSLNDLNIVSFALNAVANSQDLGNGNRITHTSTYTKADGTSHLAANLALASNPFFSKLSTKGIIISAKVKALPNVQGTGNVHDLTHAMSLANPAADRLTQLIEDFKQQASYKTQLARMDAITHAWANTSTMKTSAQLAQSKRRAPRIAGINTPKWLPRFQLIYMLPGQITADFMTASEIKWAKAYGLPTLSSMRTPKQRQAAAKLMQQQQRITAMIGLLEKFNGSHFVDLGYDKDADWAKAA